MNLTQAMDIFNIDSLEEIQDVKELKKRYRKLMFKYHPDVYNGTDDKAKDISIAHDLLQETANKIEKTVIKTRTLSNIILPMNNLLEIYNRGETQLGNKTITKKFINRNNTFILLQGELRYTYGVVNKNEDENINVVDISNIQPLQIKNIYEISTDIVVKSLKHKTPVTIKLYGKEKQYIMDFQALEVIVTLDYNIKIKVRINKKLKNNE